MLRWWLLLSGLQQPLTSKPLATAKGFLVGMAPTLIRAQRGNSGVLADAPRPPDRWPRFA
jgi:hypothetical protein